MCRSLKHGGPDDEGVFLDEGARLAFGHRRLSIIDLSRNGHQPMTDVNKKAWITFNGEIYNYPELKAELTALGLGFHSETDTEVILQAYLKWGEAAFARLRGIFAFAIYDVDNELVYIVRDSNGIKPLYYYTVNGQLSFASEVSALQAAGIATDDDPEWRVRFLAYGHIPEPYTTLKGVRSLPKGHFLRWDNKRNVYKIGKYNAVSPGTRITDYEEACGLIRDSFRKAINRQLIADAEIGVFLSGGIDSSLITLLASEQQNARLKTVSIFFDEKNYDESRYQNLVFEKIAGEKCTHLVKQQDFETFIPQIIQAMDMPTTDGINTWFISKYAHDDGLKAVLSGLGADELYGGYPSFNRIKYISYAKKVPPKLLESVVAFLAPQKYHRVGYLAYDHPLAVYLTLRGLYAPREIAGILNINHKEVTDILFRDDLTALPDAYNEEYASWMETNLYMQNQLLRDTDVMSMSHALEVRVPFLDEDFQQLTYRISPEIRFNREQGKKLLIDSFKDILPEAVWNRPKMGFSFPLQQWMQQYPEISTPNLYQNKIARQFIEKFNNNESHWSKAFALYQLQEYV